MSRAADRMHAALTYASDETVHKKIKQLLRLLHPDYSINQPLKGSKKHARIEAAFKKLNGLREAGGC